MLKSFLQITATLLIYGLAWAEEPVMVWVGYSPETLKHQQAMAINDAKKDIANNQLIIKGFGLPMPPQEIDTRAQILAKYHVSEGSLGCMVDDLSQIYVDAYNEVVNAEIAHRYGKDFWEKINSEIEKVEQQKIPSKQTGQKNET